MTKTIIHVNQHVVKRNHKTGERNPTLTIKKGRTNTYAHEVHINGPSKVIYSPDKPLSCGAKVWIETLSEIDIISEFGVLKMNKLTNECLTELGVALKRFGTYSFDDKGPYEVMDIDPLVRKLRVMPVAEATAVLLELASAVEHEGRGNSLAHALVGKLEDWDELFAHPSIAEMY